MDEQEEYEIHPLDRDYSVTDGPGAKRKKPKRTQQERIRRVGAIVFAIGFLTLLPAAVAISSFPATRIESIGSLLHQLGMVTILVGGIIIVASYRLPTVPRRVGHSSGRRRDDRNGKASFSTLVICSVVSFVGVALVSYLTPASGSPQVSFLLIQGTLTIGAAFMVVLLVWHRGFIRAYAIGVLVALSMSWFGTFIGMVGRFGRSDGMLLMLANLAIVLLSGLVCGGYVYLLESAGESRQDGDERRPSLSWSPPPSDEST